MLVSLRLQNFRGFDDHQIEFRPTTIIVGQNNAGKTTIVEALRLLSAVVLRYKNLTYKEPQEGLDAPIGVSPSLEGLDINFKTVFHRYQDPPAVLTARFQNGATVTIYLGMGSIHGVIKDRKGRVIQNRSQANQLTLPEINIMHQISPVQMEEKLLTREYVRTYLYSRRTPLHFRNQLYFYEEYFPEFKQLVEDTWSGVQVRELLKNRRDLNDENLELQIRNEDFVGELGEMGHGLQMWLQTMWFLTLAQHLPTIILDEPDIYMHADLQRRIIRLLRNRHSQIIVTTHSVEIMSEVQPSEILVVNKRKSQSLYANKLPSVQKLIDKIGSVHNVHLTRLLNTKRLILVEGNDLAILKEFQNKLYPNSLTPFQAIPNMPIGGWTGWKLAIGSSMAFKNALGESIVTYCILDSDYHTADEINERYKEAKEKNVELHIWEQKELENYLLIPNTLVRLISKRIKKGITPPSISDLNKKLIEFADTLSDDVLDGMAFEMSQKRRRLNQGGANKRVRDFIKKERDKNGNIIRLVSGKKMFSILSDWCQKNFGVSFGVGAVLKEIREDEIPSEIATVVTSIENGEKFSKV